mmetsp:Transcript_60107/g.118185  ORF Transcript_60107/g.118185 Transcript_60107/m.118185 type:complete len:847 (-) Transcript_60107:134-2674(-)
MENSSEEDIEKLQEMKTPLVDQHVNDEVEEIPTEHNKHYKDVFFLVLFGVNIICIVSLALLYGIVALSSDGVEVVKVAENGKESNVTTEFTPSVQILLGMITTLASAVIATSLWIFTLSRIASFVLNAILISLIMVPIVCGMVLFFMGFFVFGFALLLLSIALLVMSLFIRPRMDFAAMNLKVACNAVLHMPSVFGYALLAVGVQVVFCIVWGIAAVGYATSNTEVTIHAHGLNFNLDECTTYVYADTLTIPSIGTLTCTSDSCKACVCDETYINAHACTSPKLYGWTYFWLLLSLFWTSAIVANVVHCTTSAAVAKWWTTGFPTALIVQQGFERAITTSLGSICFASLLVALVRTTRSVLHFANKQLQASTHTTGVMRRMQTCIVRVLSFLLNVLDRIVVYFNRYALCFVAINGYDFMTASKAASRLFVQRGWTALLNDDIIDVVLNIGHIIIGTISMCVGYVYGRMTGVGHAYTVLLTVFGFAVGYLISIVALSTISSAVATVYVSYVDNPLALQVSHPDMYVSLSETWERMSPNRTTAGAALSAPRSNTASPFTDPAAANSTASGGTVAPTKIRGSFGSNQINSRGGQFEISRPIGTTAENTPGAFSAGFAFIAALFPSSAIDTGGMPSAAAAGGGGRGGTAHRMETGMTSVGRGGGTSSASSVSTRGGYSSLPTNSTGLDDTDNFNNDSNNNSSGDAVWGRPSHQQQHQQRVPPYTSAHTYHWGPQTTNNSQPQPTPLTSMHQHHNSQQYSQHPHHPHTARTEPMFSQNFAQAFTAINTLTQNLSNSVFGSARSPGPPASQETHQRQQQQQQGPYRGRDPYGHHDGADTSLMSVQLEESFSV